jgi:hypothetical protein
MENIPRAVLKVEIPKSRYSMLEGNKHPEIGDVLELDQAFIGKDGKPMVSAYHPIPGAENCEDNYSAEVYESEIELLK